MYGLRLNHSSVSLSFSSGNSEWASLSQDFSCGFYKVENLQDKINFALKYKKIGFDPKVDIEKIKLVYQCIHNLTSFALRKLTTENQEVFLIQEDFQNAIWNKRPPIGNMDFRSGFEYAQLDAITANQIREFYENID